MVRRVPRRYLTLVTLCLVAGCLWRGYTAIMQVHLDVLTQTAGKLCAVVDSGRGLSAEAIPEYVYPAQRAREFLRQFSSERGRQSYRQFTSLVERYESMVRDVDAVRAAGRDWAQMSPQLRAECEVLDQQAAGVRAVLARNG